MRYDARTVRPLAERIAAALEPGCEQVELAGSLRRGSRTVKDIEIVVQPRLYQTPNLWDELVVVHSELDPLLNRLVEAGKLVRGNKNGERYKVFIVPPLDIKLDLFIVRPPAQFGVIYAIRTGPGEFSRRMMTARRQGGYLPSWLKCRNGALWTNGQALDTPTERSVFEVLELDWISPAAREVSP